MRIAWHSPAPAVIVHGISDARRALAPGLPLVLLSAPGAAGYAGAGWWRALVAAVAAPSLVADVLDCGDAPGHALAALRIGQRIVVLDPRVPAFAAVAAIAGAVVLPAAPPALDMAALDGVARDAAARDAERRLLAWLCGDTAAGLG